MKTLKLIIFVFIAVALNSCEGKLDLTNPNKPTGETFWKTEADFRQAMASCYTPLKNWNGGYYGTRGLMTRISRADDIEFRNDIQCIVSRMIRTMQWQIISFISSTMLFTGLILFCKK